MNQLSFNLLNRPSKQTAIAQLVALLAVTTALPTANAQQAMPVVVNQQTGAQVELTRAYWNANVDIADRSIKCDHHRFNAESATYEFIYAREYLHAPMLTTPAVSYVIADIGIFEYASWTVQDGVYSGDVNFDSGGYLELVNYGPSTGVTTQASNNNAIRVWHSSSIYSVCFDQSGADFIPTGSADIGNTNLVVLDELDDFSFQFPPPHDHDVPAIYRDGERVSFVRGEWDYNNQLANNNVACEEILPPYNGIGSSETPIRVSQDYLAYFGGDSVYFHYTYSDFDSTDRFTDSRSTSDVDLGGLGFPNRYMELTETGFNLYVSESRYFSCTAPEPKSVVALIPDSCDYSTADQFDGWGWNDATGQSCAPAENDTSTNETTDAANSSEEIPVNEVPDEVSDNEQSTPDTENLPDDSTDNSSDTVTATDNEVNADEIDGAVSNTQNDSTSTSLNSSDEITSQSGDTDGGGSFWLPALILVLLLRRPMLVFKKQK